jgi:hypothetical protein
MLYVNVEDPKHPEEYASAVQLVGETEELATAKEQLAACALGVMAAEQEIVPNKVGERFLLELAIGDNISRHAQPMFEAVMSGKGDEPRRRVMIEKAKRGGLSSAALMEELRTIGSFPDWGENYVNTDGLLLDEPTSHVYTYNLKEEYGNEVDEGDNFAAARAVGATHGAHQRELSYVTEMGQVDLTLPSDREHSSFGIIQDGVYLPLVTQLDHSHPAIGE